MFQYNGSEYNQLNPNLSNLSNDSNQLGGVGSSQYATKEYVDGGLPFKYSDWNTINIERNLTVTNSSEYSENILFNGGTSFEKGHDLIQYVTDIEVTAKDGITYTQKILQVENGSNTPITIYFSGSDTKVVTKTYKGNVILNSTFPKTNYYYLGNPTTGIYIGKIFVSYRYSGSTESCNFKLNLKFRYLDYNV